MALLDLLGPPLLVSTPRAVKRLANSYGLLTAMRRDHRSADLDEQHASVRDPESGVVRMVTSGRTGPAMTLLAALIAFPALGPALFLHLYHTAAAHPDWDWAEFVRSLYPVHAPEGWYNAADPSMTPVQAQQWQALLDGLRHTAEAAAEHALPLPAPLSAWNQWIVPVGRLSFPTGHIVNTLDRQRPLPGLHPSGDRGAADADAARSDHSPGFGRGPWPESGSRQEPGTRHGRGPLNGQNCTVVLTDVVAFGSPNRTDADRRFIRDVSIDMTRTAMKSIWDSCSMEDRGDGLLIVVRPDVPTVKVIECLLNGLPAYLGQHNRRSADAARIQLRIAADVGPVASDEMGLSGETLIRASRLLEAHRLKKAMAVAREAWHHYLGVRIRNNHSARRGLGRPDALRTRPGKRQGIAHPGMDAGHRLSPSRQAFAVVRQLAGWHLDQP